MQQMYINTKFHLFIYSPRYSHAVGSKTNKKRIAKAYAVIVHQGGAFLNFFFKFLRGSYKNSLSYEKLTHKKFEASIRSYLAPSCGLKIEKWVKKCYFSKTFNKILKLNFLKWVDVKMLK